MSGSTAENMLGALGEAQRHSGECAPLGRMCTPKDIGGTGPGTGAQRDVHRPGRGTAENVLERTGRHSGAQPDVLRPGTGAQRNVLHPRRGTGAQRMCSTKAQRRHSGERALPRHRRTVEDVLDGTGVQRHSVECAPSKA